MAIHRGIQSALFYYLSCAPCTDARHRRKRRKAADLARLEKQASPDGPPGLWQYQHPLPSNTNPAWDLEIAIGPSKESKAAAKQRAKKDSSDAPASSNDSTKGSDRMDAQLESRMAWAGSFQRIYCEDPPLAHLQKAYTRSRSTTANSSSTAANRTPTTRTPTRLTSATINQHHNPYPALNDMHPATVTKYDSAADISWMLAPPPAARVMRGFENERPPRAPRPSLSRRVSPRLSPPLEDVSPDARNSSNPESVLDDAHLADDEQAVDERDDDDEDEEEEAQDRMPYDMEKRDSAGPPQTTFKPGDYAAPHGPWDLGSDGASGPDSEFDRTEGASTRKVGRRRGGARELRWRWSIDW